MDLFNLIKFGFGIETPAAHTQSANLNVMIAEAAFYKAEKRNFHPGYEMRDWLEAKKDILNAVYGNNHRRIHFGWEAVVNYCKFMLSNFNQAFRQQSQKDFKQSNLQWH
jgi:Protein of unknown function (DUF2934)